MILRVWYILISLLAGCLAVKAQESVFVVKQNIWDPTGTWRISARMDQSMFHEQWYFAPDHTFFVMVRGDRNNLPESYGIWEQSGSNFIMRFEQYRGKSCTDVPLVHEYRIEQLSSGSVKLTGLSFDNSTTHPAAVSMVRQ